MKERVIITGTGRAGTTFLIQLLEALGNDVGDIKQGGYSFHSNAGYEIWIDHPSDPFIVKSPTYCYKIPKLVKDYDIKLVLCPIRDLSATVKSRCRVGQGNGGLWHANTFKEQTFVHTKVVYTLAHTCAKLDIPLVFLDFARFFDKSYLYSKLNHPCLKLGKYQEFCDQHDKLFDSSLIHY